MERAQCVESKLRVAKQITDLEPGALYTHYYGHALNLAASDAIKQSRMRWILPTR